MPLFYRQALKYYNKALVSDRDFLKVPYGFQSICKQTCKHLVRCTLHILMYMLIFSQPNS